MINRAIGVLRGKFANALAHAPPPPKPASEMNVVEIVAYNKIPSELFRTLVIFYLASLTCPEFYCLKNSNSFQS